MHIILIGIWIVVSSVVGKKSVDDIKQERRDHEIVKLLKQQQVAVKPD